MNKINVGTDLTLIGGWLTTMADFLSAIGATIAVEPEEPSTPLNNDTQLQLNNLQNQLQLQQKQFQKQQIQIQLWQLEQELKEIEQLIKIKNSGPT